MTERFIRDTSAPFNLDILGVDNPAAGANFLIKLPETYTYELLAVTLQLVTDVNVANRNLVICGNLGTDRIFAAPAEGLQTASETLYYWFGINAQPYDLSATSGVMAARLPSQTPLPGATTLTSLLDSIQVGDQLSNIHLYLKRWPILEG